MSNKPRHADSWPKPPPIPKPLRGGGGGGDSDGVGDEHITPVGMFGGCEVRIVNGPVFMDKPYHVTREMVGKGETRGAVSYMSPPPTHTHPTPPHTQHPHAPK